MIKAPDERLPYGVDFSKWLANEGDTAASAAWTVADGLTSDTPTLSGGIAYLWLSGGVLGSDYPVTCTLTTTGGRVREHTLRISVRQR